MSVRTTSDAMAEINAAIAHHQTKIFETARRQGLRDPFEAYAADGLLAMARASMSGGSAKRVPTKVIIRVDHSALTRGHVHDGEICEHTGTGPIPIMHVAEMVRSGDVFTAVVATDERGQVTTVAHLGSRKIIETAVLPETLVERGVDVTGAFPIRRPNTYQYTALDWTSPTCSVAGCDLPRQQVDHRDPYRKTLHTKLDECDGYCCFHHADRERNGPRIPAGIGRRKPVDRTAA
jgi:hypothetical protein